MNGMPSETPTVDPTADALVQQLRTNEELETKLAQLAKKVEKLTEDGPRLKQAGSGPSIMPKEEIEKFLKEDSPHLFFSDHWMRAGEIEAASNTVNPATGKTERTPHTWVEQTKWWGPGAELKDPTDKSGQQPLLTWGYLDITKHEAITSGRMTVQRFCALMRESRFFKKGIWFDSAEAKARLHMEYAKRAEERRLQLKYEQDVAEMRPGEEKLGSWGQKTEEVDHAAVG